MERLFQLFQERGLNERQIKAVFSVVDKQAITNKEYQELFTISKRTATSDLAALVDHGIFRKIGRGKRDLKYVLR